MAAVSPKALEGTRKALTLQEQHSQREGSCKAASHRSMVAHYRLLARRAWKHQANDQSIGLL